MVSCMTLHKSLSVVPRPSCAVQWILNVLEDCVAAIIESYNISSLNGPRRMMKSTLCPFQDCEKINYMGECSDENAVPLLLLSYTQLHNQLPFQWSRWQKTEKIFSLFVCCILVKSRLLTMLVSNTGRKCLIINSLSHLF